MNRTQAVAIVAAAVAALGVGVGVGYRWGRGAGHAPAAPAPGSRTILYWYDPMRPDQHFDKPGKSPFMDMPLLPKYAEAASIAGIAVDPAVRQALGIRTVPVRRGLVSAAATVPGTIAWDLRLERVVSARVDAVVDRVFVRAPYARVRAGQPLASVLAPAWSSALAEAQALRDGGSAAARGVRSAAQARLRVLGLPEHARVRDGRIVLVAPADGVLSELAAREGAMAPAGTLLFRINGTTTVWLEAALPQAAIAAGPGTPVEARVPGLPGRVFAGRVQALLPQFDSGSRSRLARIVLDNPQGELAPGMFAQVTLHPAPGGEQLLVPADAVIGEGAQARVIVLAPDGRFRPLAVRTGRSGGGVTEILSGLRGDERVVASGQFLIDSEASLSGAMTRLGAADGGAADAEVPEGPVAPTGAAPTQAGDGTPKPADAPSGHAHRVHAR